MKSDNQNPFIEKLRLRKEVILELTPRDLANVAGGACTCTSDFSNDCCGPNGSCKPIG